MSVPGLVIFCLECQGPRPALKLERHQHPVGWFNRCSSCSTMYPALPPRAAAVRYRRRLYVRRSGQVDLFTRRPR